MKRFGYACALLGFTGGYVLAREGAPVWVVTVVMVVIILAVVTANSGSDS